MNVTLRPRTSRTPLPTTPAARNARTRREAGWALATAALTSIGAAVTLQLWRADLHIPFSYDNDGQLYGLLVKQTIHGWYLTNPLLGAPFGSQLFDFPQGGDQLHFLVIKALGLTTSDWALAMNLFFLLMFPVVGVTSYAVMRALGASLPAATLCATLFALLPYHFRQGEFHIFLSAYYAVPLGCYLVFAAFHGKPLFARRSGRLTWGSRRSLVTIALCCVIGSAGLYYAVFTAVLLLLGGVVTSVRRTPRALMGPLIAAAAIFVVLGLNISPTLAYRVSHGTDSAAFRRTPSQSVSGSLTPGELLLPLSEHRIAAFGRLRRSYSGPLYAPELTTEGESATLGLLASVGFVSLAFTLIARTLGKRVGWNRGNALPLAGAALSAFLLATVGGIAIAYLITPDIRQWNRLSIFIGFFSLLAVALIVDALRVRLRPRRGGRIIVATALVAIGALAFLDQTSSELIPPYRQVARAWRSDQSFVAAIEHRLPRASAVLELPYMPWPEPGFVNAMTSYAPARGYLHSTSLRWSYGAMRGRPADWQAQLAPDVVAPASAAAGFGGIYVDRSGYPSAAARGLERTLRRLLGVRPLVSADRRLAFFDERSYARRLRRAIGEQRWHALRDATLHPLRLDAGRGAEAPPPEDYPTMGVGLHGRVLIRGTGELDARSPSGRERTAIFAARLSSGAPVTVVFADGAPLRLAARGRPVAVCRPIDIRGRAAVRFHVAGSTALRVDGARVIDLAFMPFIASGQCAA